MSSLTSRLLLTVAIISAPLFAAETAAPAAAPVAPIAAPRGRASPHETVNATIGGSRVVVIYGRPYSKDPRSAEIRKIWGTLVPYGQVWRLGSDEATLLITEAALDFGGTTVPAGAYSLHMLPVENGTSKLIINKHIGQWGIPYTQAAEELARIDLKKDTVSQQVDQLTLTVESVQGSNPPGGRIRFQWENLQFSVGFTKK
jgi:hypothetical protein